MKIEIINIGSELLDGTRVNSNLLSLAKALKELDLEIARGIIIGDKEESILDALRASFSRVKIVILTGGLGPTIDDLTKKAVTKFFGKRLILDNNVLNNVEEYYKKLRIEPPKFVYNQALIPQGAKVLSNPKGTAPGLIIEEKDKILAVLPGVPAELNYLVEGKLIPYLKERVKFSTRVSRTFKIYGLTEAELSEKIKLTLRQKEIKFSFLPHYQIEVVLKIETKGNNANNLIQKTEEEITRVLGDTIYGRDEETLEEVVGMLLSMQEKKIAVVESCTGGLISHRLTNIPGSSRYFKEAVIAYSNKSKIDLLGVNENLLERRGAVSEEVAKEMAVAVKNKAKVDLGLAVTGIAGPTGATADKTPPFKGIGGSIPVDKPVGLSFIALAEGDKVISQKFQFQGERALIKLKAAQAALNIIRLNLIKK